MKKKFLTFLMMLVLMAFASVAVAAIPTLSRDRYLVTKIYSSSSIPVFTDSNLNVQGTAVPKKAYKASIAPNDDIYVFNYSGNSWAYVSYPTSSGRKEGYIRMSDLTPNNHWQDPQRARKSMSTYTRPGGAKYGSISNGDTVHTIAAANYRFQVVYPINNGRQYKMAWVTDADYLGYIAPSSPVPPPTPSKLNDAMNYIASLEGKAMDFDNYAGAQCVDLIKYYYNYLGVPNYAKGNGKDYATNSLPPGWQRIKGAVPQRGDILVYTSGGGGYGHVAIAESISVSWHQNFNGKYVRKISGNYKTIHVGYWGVIRPVF